MLVAAVFRVGERRVAGKKNKWVYPGLAGFKWVAFPKSKVESRNHKKHKAGIWEPRGGGFWCRGVDSVSKRSHGGHNEEK